MSGADLGVVLAMLVDCDGAIEHASVPASRRRAFAQALSEERVLFDERADCYVHPKATCIGIGRYTMRGAA